MTLAVPIIYTASVTVGVADEMAHVMFEASCEEMWLPQMVFRTLLAATIDIPLDYITSK
jgi:hypothetical protein